MNNKGMVKCALLLLLLGKALWAELPLPQVFDKITHYRVYWASGEYAARRMIVFRTFDRSRETFYLGVDPESLETFVVPASQALIKPMGWAELREIYKNTAYMKAIQTVEKKSFALQDVGVVHGFSEQRGITLTIDLCPSRKPLDRMLFTSLINEFEKQESPVPVGLSITGLFMLTHPEDMEWLRELMDARKISVTWINHTYHHRYDPKKPLAQNFVLEPHTNMDYEILQTEAELLQRRFLPSVFFRFPGLVSDHRAVDQVIRYGLIPIGTDAWLAKGQPARSGSIVLIHGNGNEPLGVRDFLLLLKTQKPDVLKKNWFLYDLRKTVGTEFRK